MIGLHFVKHTGYIYDEVEFKIHTFRSKGKPAEKENIWGLQNDVKNK